MLFNLSNRGPLQNKVDSFNKNKNKKQTVHMKCVQLRCRVYFLRKIIEIMTMHIYLKMLYILHCLSGVVHQ